MQEVEIYSVIRQEIIYNHGLMHWFTFLVLAALLAGCKIIEMRKTILSVFLPLMSLGWAASVIRFDFFIHRQGAYLRILERRIQDNGISIELWETWKGVHTSGVFVIPLADVFIFIVILIPTAYILFVHAREYFDERNWRGGNIYVWAILGCIVCLLGLIPFIPYLTRP